MAKKSNSGTFLLLGAAGVGVYGYMQGWFSSFGFGPAVGPTPTQLPPASAATNAAIAAAQAAATPAPVWLTPAGVLSSTPVPYTYNAVGTPATPAPASNPPYIIPAQNPVPAVPSGYTVVNTLDAGTVFLRNDVFATEFAKNIQVGSPVANITMASIKTDAGLAAYNGFRGYVFARTGRYR